MYSLAFRAGMVCQIPLMLQGLAAREVNDHPPIGSVRALSGQRHGSGVQTGERPKAQQKPLAPA